MNVARFQLRYPEFAQTDQNIVQAKLVAASVRMGGPDRRIWGTYATDDQPYNQADAAQAALAAALLISSPFGTETRLTEDGKTSSYYAEWEELVEANCGGVTVAGLSSCGPWW